MAQLTQLPEEITIQHIAGRLRPRELLQLCATNPVFSYLCENDRVAEAILRATYPRLITIPGLSRASLLRELASSKEVVAECWNEQEWGTAKYLSLVVGRINTLGQLYNALLNLPFLVPVLEDGALLPLTTIIGLASLLGIHAVVSPGLPISVRRETPDGQVAYGYVSVLLKDEREPIYLRRTASGQISITVTPGQAVQGDIFPPNLVLGAVFLRARPDHSLYQLLSHLAVSYIP